EVAKMVSTNRRKRQPGEIIRLRWKACDFVQLELHAGSSDTDFSQRPAESLLSVDRCHSRSGSFQFGSTRFAAAKMPRGVIRAHYQNSRNKLSNESLNRREHGEPESHPRRHIVF